MIHRDSDILIQTLVEMSYLYAHIQTHSIFILVNRIQTQFNCIFLHINVYTEILYYQLCRHLNFKYSENSIMEILFFKNNFQTQSQKGLKVQTSTMLKTIKYIVFLPKGCLHQYTLHLPLNFQCLLSFFLLVYYIYDLTIFYLIFFQCFIQKLYSLYNINFILHAIY